MKKFLLLPFGLLCACAPTTTASKPAQPTGVSNPLTPGDVYHIEGKDQNGVAFDYKTKITVVPTQYDAANQEYTVDTDNGVFYLDSGRILSQAWIQVGKNLLVCVSYQNERAFPYHGRAMSGTAEEIEGLVRRLHNSDSSFFGASACSISKT